MSIRIICINKDSGNHYNPHEAISYYGWINESNGKQGKSNRPAMVKFVNDGNKVYVKDTYGNIAYCYVRTSQNGTEFLQTNSDGTYTDNLLKLLECLE
jgi:hypothetical protein